MVALLYRSCRRCRRLALAAAGYAAPAAQPSGIVIAVIQSAEVDGATGRRFSSLRPDIFSGDRIITGARRPGTDPFPRQHQACRRPELRDGHRRVRVQRQHHRPQDFDQRRARCIPLHHRQQQQGRLFDHHADGDDRRARHRVRPRHRAGRQDPRSRTSRGSRSESATLDRHRAPRSGGLHRDHGDRLRGFDHPRATATSSS